MQESRKPRSWCTATHRSAALNLCTAIFASAAPLLTTWSLSSSPDRDLRTAQLYVGTCCTFLAAQFVHQARVTRLQPIPAARKLPRERLTSILTTGFAFAATFYATSACLYFFGLVGKAYVTAGNKDVSVVNLPSICACSDKRFFADSRTTTFTGSAPDRIRCNSKLC